MRAVLPATFAGSLGVRFPAARPARRRPSPGQPVERGIGEVARHSGYQRGAELAGTCGDRVKPHLLAERDFTLSRTLVQGR
ncbi:hypothetical protein [Streptomyces sp. NPDC001222]|uniref:hypothetical protein n=1 Tax=Streptomyces sp. NPDC001222 TaxID=3364548 RepID=UPI0036C31D92